MRNLRFALNTTAAALLILSIDTPALAETWKFGTSIDSMTDKKGEFISGENRDAFQLMVTQVRGPNELFVSIILPSKFIGSVDTQKVGMIRFDDEQPFDIGTFVSLQKYGVVAAFANRNSMSMVVDRFVTRRDGKIVGPLHTTSFLAATRLRARFYMFGGNTVDTEFQLAGLADAIHDHLRLPLTLSADEAETKSILDEANSRCSKDALNPKAACHATIKTCEPKAWDVTPSDLRACMGKALSKAQ